MDSLRELVGHSVAWGLAVISLAVTLGLALGAVRWRGIRLGVAGVLFSALVFGQLGLTLDEKVLEFLRDFALITFVYAVGLQVGPGFVTSLREEGLRLNVLSLLVIALGAAMTAAIVWLAKLDRLATSGLYAGAFTTTPGLAAGQEALKHMAGGTPQRIAQAMAITGTAYTVTYPLGIVGPILVIAFLKRLFGVRMDEERSALTEAEERRRPPVTAIDFEVMEGPHVGFALKDCPVLRDSGIIFSRLLREKKMTVPTAETIVQVGDVFRAVGPRTQLARVAKSMGRLTSLAGFEADGEIQRTDLVVTRTAVLRRTLRELNLIRRTGAAVARVNRAGVELTPKASLRLQFGDRVTAVGPPAGLKMIEADLGNCPDILNRPQLIPIFLGIVVGVLVGSIPLIIPGLHTRLRIGLAGGPMIAAIVLSQFGNIGSVVWYMPVAANQLFRDFGLAVFLACVGLKAGNHFLENLNGGAGLVLIFWGVLITILPVLMVGIVARLWLKMNFITLSGWVAGAMTSSPGLLFANDISGSDAPAVPYAAVAPLATLAPIICAQLLVVAMR